MTTTAWIFPGQGSQKIGMGSNLFEQSEHQERLKLAEKILGWSVPEICQHPEDKISQTLYTQPSLYVLESLLVDQLKQQGQSPDYVAGHSLGEYVALYAAGVFDFETGLKLVQCRAELMSSAAGGQMAALIGFDREQLDQQIQQTPNIVLANDNSTAQVVISGTPEAVDQVLANIKVKRAVKLNVSGAFHSPLMQESATQFQQILDGISFNNAQIPVISNVDPTPTTDATLLKQRLTQQMTGSVRWREICLQLSTLGVAQVVEIGPGNVLTGLMKRTCPEILLQNI
ncbi:Malonyl CoA-acyl carrier protein transacylase [Planktothrix sp. PCC 11201]|uniref:ACP S-malonyltransferase n=1 Tax=Planktothrix sp. PCC 11201 TaxID=1729650 RepID=UPI0009191849|nr:ACP S-malonyltransferase [Planktothrix sp. PCC 11201]SKB12991.1 Malonyl CoA-acyl carrier protein transacylase [Planktothrix sp. PCC 11201]